MCATLVKQHGQHICSVIKAIENIDYREALRSLIATDKKAQQSLLYNIFKKNNHHILHELRSMLKTTENETCSLTITKFMVALIQIFIYITRKPQSRPGYKIFITSYCFSWESEHDCTFFDKP